MLIDKLHVFGGHLSFLVQIVIAEAMFLPKMKPKKCFGIRLFVCIVTIIGITYFLMENISFSPVNIVSRMLAYFIMFAMTLLLFIVCFDEKKSVIIFGATVGYAAENFTSKLYYTALFCFSNCIKLRLLNTWIMYLTRGLFFAVIYFAIYFCIGRKSERSVINLIKNRSVIKFSLVILVITIILSVLSDRYILESLALSIIIAILTTISCMFVIYNQYFLLKKIKTDQDAEFLNYLWRQKKEQYELSKDIIDLINIKCHDMRFQLNSLLTNKNLTITEELDKIEKAINIYDSSVNTGNTALDVILTEKSLFCEKNNIRLTSIADATRLGFVQDWDLYSLIGNALENAINAVLDVKDYEKRLISFNIREVKGVLLIHMQNYYSGTIEFENGFPKTNKDIEYHGFGIRSMINIVKKYNGYLSMDTDEDIFYLRITIPLS